VYKLCRIKICGGSAPTPPAETVVSALCVRILSTLISVFASLFAKSEWVSGQRPETPKKGKKCFAHSLQMSVVKKVTPKNFIKVQKSFGKSFLVLFSTEKRTGFF
jgi:hypothetical protein